MKLKTLAEKLNTQYDNNSVEAKWNDFENSVRNIMDSCIPYKMTSSRYNLPWFNRSLQRQSRAKQRLYNKAKKTGSEHHWNKFFAARKHMHKNLKLAREEYIGGHLSEAIKVNPKRFWSYIKRLEQENPEIADFEVDGKKS